MIKVLVSFENDHGLTLRLLICCIFRLGKYTKQLDKDGEYSTPLHQCFGVSREKKQKKRKNDRKKGWKKGMEKEERREGEERKQYRILQSPYSPLLSLFSTVPEYKVSFHPCT